MSYRVTNVTHGTETFNISLICSHTVFKYETDYSTRLQSIHSNVKIPYCQLSPCSILRGVREIGGGIQEEPRRETNQHVRKSRGCSHRYCRRNYFFVQYFLLNLSFRSGCSALALSAICLPFVTPALRRVCLPYVPATDKQVENVFKALARGNTTSTSSSSAKRPTLVDIGSGDGRIVSAAAHHCIQMSFQLICHAFPGS